jgi:hypothetical protein
LTSNNDGDFTDAVKLRVKTTFIDFVGADCGAEGDRRGVNLVRCQQFEQIRWKDIGRGDLTISWLICLALQRIDPRPIPGKTYMLLCGLSLELQS